jgi:integrase/recombinase XerD
MKLDELLHRFQDDLQIRNYSARTVSDYGYNLVALFRFLGQRQIADIQSVTQATLVDFQRWVYYQPTKQGTPRGVVSQNGILAAVKSFCHFLKTEGYLARDPAEGIEYAREPHRLPRNVLTPEEAKRIIEAVDTTTVLGYRDRTILEVLYATGIRNQELRNLTVTDVNLEEGLLRVNCGKGAKDRVTPLGQIASRFLETYLNGIRPQLLGGRHASALFLSYRGNAIDAHSVGDLVKRHAGLANVKKHVTPHVWRHTCATHLVQNNANLRHVQDLLGHGSLATTERYLRLTIVDLKEAHAKLHPREQAS